MNAVIIVVSLWTCGVASLVSAVSVAMLNQWWRTTDGQGLMLATTFLTAAFFRVCANLIVAHQHVMNANLFNVVLCLGLAAGIGLWSSRLARIMVLGLRERRLQRKAKKDKEGGS